MASADQIIPAVGSYIERHAFHLVGQTRTPHGRKTGPPTRRSSVHGPCCRNVCEPSKLRPQSDQRPVAGRCLARLGRRSAPPLPGPRHWPNCRGTLSPAPDKAEVIEALTAGSLEARPDHRWSRDSSASPRDTRRHAQPISGGTIRFFGKLNRVEIADFPRPRIGLSSRKSAGRVAGPLSSRWGRVRPIVCPDADQVHLCQHGSPGHCNCRFFPSRKRPSIWGTPGRPTRQARPAPLQNQRAFFPFDWRSCRPAEDAADAAAH